ncbi:hypothetical protein AOPFMNJM_4057 [Methylobacterium jeotgali]|uniref:Uncharacterized protein n=1 Tax=Methylobacterium jeotgali TaxID=381630 RepID=A0ABQ4T050_9HYPH|nr:hypothetical protein AwMethylo_28350 [Methylobacterium sp.]GJE08712.1 hypothetical protein AOPFMNJM_4057 [Methylobacterium jeotgali]
MPEVKPSPRAGAIRRSVKSADQKGVFSGAAMAGAFMLDPLCCGPQHRSGRNGHPLRAYGGFAFA